MKETSQNDQHKKAPSEVEVNALGSLGLLALGHVGLRKWREARKKENKLKKKK